MTVTAGVTVAAANLIRFLETNAAPAGLFAPDCFADLSLPRWRLQAGTADDVVTVRNESHPSTGEVCIERLDHTEHGFVVQFEERWTDQGQRWYSREMIRADVVGERIVEMAVYCTGDWDERRQREHATAVTLIRP
jgi:hypothetical protein